MFDNDQINLEEDIRNFVASIMLNDYLAVGTCWPSDDEIIHWNLSVTTTSIIKFITDDLFSNVF